MYPELSQEEISKEITNFFGAISDILPPLDQEHIPKDLGGQPLDALQPHQVCNMIKKAKKPNSMVYGDIFPDLYTMFDFSKAVTPVYNKVISSKTWPEDWKIETITVIPKCPSPASLSECRNISCTNFLSKVMESHILSKLREDIPDDMIQCGGTKGVGVEHLLVEVWERILGGLELPYVAVSLLEIDYEKAFNRMCHNQCLQQLGCLPKLC